MANLCFDVNLEDTLKDASLPFYALIDKDTDIYYQDFKSVVEARKFRYRRKEQVIEDISESSKTDLLRMAEKKRKARSQYIKVYYQGVMNTKGWIYFKTTSQYTKNKFYTQYIRINEAKDFKYFKEFDKRDIVRLFMSGDLSVYCSCLKNDTQIKLLDGRVLPVEEMEREYRDGKELWVYSTDSKGDFRPGKVTKVWVSGMTEQYIKVTLDNGREILTTGNHPYMLRDGSYLDAGKLKVGQSLMPLSASNNHSIVAIEVIDLPNPEPVYDISVDKWENFLVDAGAILHNCPDFLYRGYKYMGHNMGYGIFKEVRFPKIRNPQLEGSVCKHLIAVLKVFGMHWNSIAKDMVKTKYWKKRYED